MRVDADSTGMLVKPTVARQQMDAEAAAVAGSSAGAVGAGVEPTSGTGGKSSSGTSDGVKGTTFADRRPHRFHGTVQLDPARVGRDASRIADEVIAHLAGQVGADVIVTLEIEASLPDGASEQIVRTVTENSRTLNFASHGFEAE